MSPHEQLKWAEKCVYNKNLHNVSVRFSELTTAKVLIPFP